MKNYEVEIIRTSYITWQGEADNEEEAKDKAWEWYAGVGDCDDAHSEINYCEEVK